MRTPGEPWLCERDNSFQDMTIPRTLVAAGLAVTLAVSGCKTTPEKEKAEKAAQTKPKKPANIPDQSGDVAFQGFVSRLRQAVNAHDVQEIAAMMTTDFGYRLEPLGEGAGVFEYWDQNNVWPELALIMNEKFVPNGKYMVTVTKKLVSAQPLSSQLSPIFSLSWIGELGVQ